MSTRRETQIATSVFTSNGPSTRKSHKKESCRYHVQTDFSNSASSSTTGGKNSTKLFAQENGIYLLVPLDMSPSRITFSVPMKYVDVMRQTRTSTIGIQARRKILVGEQSTHERPKDHTTYGPSTVRETKIRGYYSLGRPKDQIARSLRRRKRIFDPKIQNTSCDLRI